MRDIRICAFLFLLFFAAIAQACVKGLTDEQKTVMKYMLQVDGVYSKEIHVIFWQPLAVCTEDELMDLRAEMSDLLRLGIDGQKSKYKSALLSIAFGKPLYDSSYYEYLEKEIKFKLERGYSLEKLENEKSQTRELIIAALKGNMIEKDGEFFYVDLITIESVLWGLDGSFERAVRLFSPPDDD